ncbi:MAG: DUF1501 domain-containing protein [Pirellulaceae bacterium]|nr:DUF1501 domain-containing protein [Pirellulaceae bacterium]
MLSYRDGGTRLCDGIRRREWLRIGGLSAFGLGLDNYLAVRSSAADAGLASSFGRAKACIVLFMLGGPPQHETWDPKPLAPTEIRGSFGTIPTATPGLRVGELMPLTARLTDRIAVLRAMSTNDNSHSSSGYWMLTGRPHAPTNSENARAGAPNDWPCMAAIMRHLRGDQGSLPGAVRLPEEIWNTGRIVWPGQDAGWLGDAADPWLVTCDPSQPDFQVGDISLPPDVDVQRLMQRRQLLDGMNARTIDAASTDQLPSVHSRWSGFQHKAIELLQSASAREAFAIDRETSAMRDRYGRNRFGQSVLLARRLVEAGVSLVQVNWTRWPTDTNMAPAWDTHAGNAKRCKEALMPPMDLAYSALIEDLSQRGMLDETLIVWMGEFGRSPKINAAGGRDHWGHVFSVALAGGGVQGGAVYGQSDRLGGYPIEGRAEPQDLSATIFHLLGYAPETQLIDKLGRPLAISTGKVIEPIV